MKIELSLPKHWNLCTTGQLELIADVMREQVDRTDRYHPFSMDNVKIALFFLLAGIEVIEGPNPRVPVEEQYYTCRLKKNRPWFFQKNSLSQKKNRPWFFSLPIKAKGETFSLYLWQINYWLSPKVNAQSKGKSTPEAIAAGAGLLSWLDSESNQFLTKFPYPTIKRSRPLLPQFKSVSFPTAWLLGISGKTFKGPSTDLDGFSWAQYRLASEAMQSHTQLANNLIKMKQMGTFSDDQMLTQFKSVDLSKAMFLATIFIKKTKYVDTNTGIIKHDFHYESNQITDNAEYFRNFPDTQWQVILFWWTGIMHTLAKRYPHVFKVQKVKKNQQKESFFNIYSATIATMQKYVGLDENQCNNQSYSLVLEQLERMAKENEEIERMRKKK